MNAPEDKKDDQGESSGGTVAGRTATVVDKKSEAASPGAKADKEAASDKGLEDD